jgi:hypothetical protein
MNIKRFIAPLSLVVMLLALPMQQVFALTFEEDVIVSTSDLPSITLEQTETLGGEEDYSWTLSGDFEDGYGQFIISDDIESTTPFAIGFAAPDYSLFVESNGNVGLGTWYPDAKLHVTAASGAGVDSILLQNTIGPARLVLENTSITNTSTENSKWVFNSNGTLRLGAVGSGVREFELFAGGDLKIKGSLFTGSDTEYPDFVFKDNYPLMPLNDLNKFIEKEGHLPNMASAEEVKKAGGVNMTELQIKLLEKVEELTLYTLKQQSMIDTQQARIDTLEQKVKDSKQ